MPYIFETFLILIGSLDPMFLVHFTVEFEPFLINLSQGWKDYRCESRRTELAVTLEARPNVPSGIWSCTAFQVSNRFNLDYPQVTVNGRLASVRYYPKYVLQ